MTRGILFFLALLFCVCLLIIPGSRNKALTLFKPASAEPSNYSEGITGFSGNPLWPKQPDEHIPYSHSIAGETFFVHIPARATSQSLYGLLVFVSSGDDVRSLPPEWSGVLYKHQMIFIAPENVGNAQSSERRYGLAVQAALEMMKSYPIDPQRVYISGISGGARIAQHLGFYQPDVFHGTIQNCGADFYAPVPKVYATSQTDTNGNPYGYFNATADEISRANLVRFAIITGSADFRRGNILDIYYGGFSHSGLHSKLFDIQGMGHQTAGASTLEAAFNFIETGQ